MADTIRNIVRFIENEYRSSNWDKYRNSVEKVEVDDTQLKFQIKPYTGKRMSPYSKDRRHKLKVNTLYATNIRNNSYRHREEIKNANRSFKKGLRQEYKKEIRELLDDYYNKI